MDGIVSEMRACAGTVEVGAHTALLTLCVFIYMAVPFGIATAATIRVGNVRLLLLARLQNALPSLHS